MNLEDLIYRALVSSIPYDMARFTLIVLIAGFAYWLLTILITHFSGGNYLPPKQALHFALGFAVISPVVLGAVHYWAAHQDARELALILPHPNFVLERFHTIRNRGSYHMVYFYLPQTNYEQSPVEADLSIIPAQRVANALATADPQHFGRLPERVAETPEIRR